MDPKKKLWIAAIVAVIIVALAVTAAVAFYLKMNDLKNQQNLADGLVGERDRKLMEADAEIGRLNSELADQKELRKKAEDVLAANGGEWEKERKKYKWKIDSLTQANAELSKKIEHLTGTGGVFVSDAFATKTASSSDALTQVRLILQQYNQRLGWQFAAPNDRVVIRTTDVFASPPVADLTTNQHFKIDAMVVRTNTGVKQSYMRLYEVDPSGQVISETPATGNFSWQPEETHWYDHVLVGARAGAEANRDARVRVPLYGQLGYQSLGGLPWAVSVDPYAALDGQHEGLRLDYGAGLYFHIRKP